MFQKLGNVFQLLRAILKHVAKFLFDLLLA